jgi:hypothetical protein
VCAVGVTITVTVTVTRCQQAQRRLDVAAACDRCPASGVLCEAHAHELLDRSIDTEG